MNKTDIWKIIVELYNTSTVPVRFVYIFWTLFIAVYVLINFYEKIHNLVPKRELNFKNYHYTLFLLGGAAIIIHHGSLHANFMFYSEICSNPNMFWWLGIFGFIFMCFGLYLVGYARIILNGRWGVHVYTYLPDDELLTTNRIYSQCRHPVYAGQILMTIGSVMLCNNWWLIFFPVGTAILNIWRAKNEEKNLQDRFGEKYSNYKRKVSFIIPYIK